MNNLGSVQQLAVMILPLIFAITLHEAAHGWMASKLGDQTARQLGRVSLNPLRHIDPLGTIVLPLVMFLSTSFVFGWAKPVPVSFQNLRHLRRDTALVALAGPGANLLMMFFWGVMAHLGVILHGMGFNWVALPLAYMGSSGLMINAVLMVLNLFPLPPLDGGRVLVAALPPRVARTVDGIEPYGLIILVVLLATGILGQLLGPFITLSQQVVGRILELIF